MYSGTAQVPENFTSLGEEKISLNRLWQFKPDPKLLGLPNECFLTETDFPQWDSIAVTSSWKTENESAYFNGQVFYKRNFEVSSSWKKSKVHLKLAAVYERASVCLNRTKIGQHIRGCTLFECDVSDYLNVNGNNILVDLVNNRCFRGVWWNGGVINRDVSLVKNNKVRMNWQHIQAVPDFRTKNTKVTAKIRISNSSDFPLEGTLKYKLLKWKKEKNITDLDYSNETFTKVHLDSSVTVDIEILVAGNYVKRWHFDHLQLYLLELYFLADKKVQHHQRDRFGVLKIEADRKNLLLNAEAIRLNCFNRVPDLRVCGNTKLDHLIWKSIDDIKRLGTKFIRILHASLSENLLVYLDEVEFLVIEEIPFWGKTDLLVFSDNKLPKSWLTEMVYLDLNHPNIIGCSVANGLKNNDYSWKNLTMTLDQVNYIKNAIEYIGKELDTLWIKTYVSFSALKKRATSTVEPIESVYIVCINSYADTFNEVKRVHERWTNNPIFTTEISKDQINLEPNEAVLDSRMTNFINKLRLLDYLFGTSLWTYSDYRTLYKASLPLENWAYGLVNAWRQNKSAYWEKQERFFPISNLTIVIDKTLSLKGEIKADIELHPGIKKELPSYTLNNYLFRIIVKNKMQNSIDISDLELPSIEPGDSIINKFFCFPSKQENVQSLIAQLVSFTRINMHESVHFFEVPDSPKIQHLINGKKQITIFPNTIGGAQEYECYCGQKGVNTLSHTTINTLFDIQNLDPDKEYGNTVMVINSKEESEPFDHVLAILSTKIIPPIVSAETSVNIGFHVDYSVSEADSRFDIQNGTCSGQYDQGKSEITLKGSFTVKNLPKKQTYYYKIRSTIAGRKSHWSEKRTVTTL